MDRLQQTAGDRAGCQPAEWHVLQRRHALYASNASAFFYGPDRSRYKQLRNQETNDGFLQSTIIYVGGIYEHHDNATKPHEDRAYIQAGGQTIAIRIERDNNDNDTEYLHRDHLGSVTAMTDSSGDVQNHYSYDAFGKRRFDDWFANPSDSLLYDLAIEPRRGFTGHEHLDNVGLIHMNGRVYDPILGRFTSPDTYVQFPETTQGFNRYTYVNNNPLSYTDASGHLIDPVTVAIIGAAIAATGEVLDEPLLTQVGFAIIGAATPGFLPSVGVGFGSGFAASGGNLKAGLYSAATAAAFAGVHAGFELPGVTDVLGGQGSAGYYAAKAVVHGVVGGASSDLQGGSFTDAFIGAAASQFATAKFNAEFKNTSPAGEVIIAATIGGTAAELSGGKFANGAVSAAFAKAFNDLAFASGDPEYTEYKIVDGKMVRQDLNGHCATARCAMMAGSMNHEGAATKQHDKAVLDQTLFRVQVASTPFAVLAPFTVAGRVANGVLIGADAIGFAAEPSLETALPPLVGAGVTGTAARAGFGAASDGMGIGASIVTDGLHGGY
ncbi:Rhs family protein [Salinisphaera shabanensis E1L3A]|uniref:Rhs family protein n=2 Tax=Salinisphaera shabanensis TaxID=180542 RepID=U2EM73_9GAMM|nr:Rhs family protein [Salinisphaera shabanensis E1L3A]